MRLRHVRNRLFREITKHTDLELFARSINALHNMEQSPARICYSSEEQCFYAHDKKDCHTRIAFPFKERARLFRNGVSTRFSRLKKEYLLDFIDFHDHDTIVDVGANIGEVGLLLNQHQTLNYIAFEPSLPYYECLRKNVADGTLYNAAASAKNGEISFYVSDQTADSSIVAPPSYDSIITVPTIRLSEIIRSPVKLLKLEAEGAEPEVLDGLGDSIRFVRYICADLGHERGANKDSPFPEVTHHLIDKGFQLLHVGHPRLVALFLNPNA